jgi:DNA-directed RNA polymerase specialized sigma24 family protein
MQVRRSRTRREHCLDSGDATACPADAARADDGELAWALGRLAPPLREVVVLRYFVGCSHREIADLLAISAAASEIRLCRAIKALRLMLQHGTSAHHRAVATHETRDESFALPHASSF